MIVKPRKCNIIPSHEYSRDHNTLYFGTGQQAYTVSKNNYYLNL